MFKKILESSNLTYLPINLQLFAEPDEDEVIEEVVDDIDDVVDYQDDVEEFEVSDDDDESENNEEVAEPRLEDEVEDESTDGQSKKEQQIYRKMRLKAEAEAKRKIEAELEAERAEIERYKREVAEKQEVERLRREYLTQEKIWDKADEKGVSEEVARELLEIELEKAISAEKAKVRERQEFIKSQKAELQGDDYFNLIEKDVDSVLEQNPHLDFQTVYFHMVGKRRKELDSKLSSKVEKRTIANVQDRMKRRNVDSPAVAPGKTSLSKTTMEINNVLGVDSREVAKHKKKNSHRFKF